MLQARAALYLAVTLPPVILLFAAPAWPWLAWLSLAWTTLLAAGLDEALSLGAAAGRTSRGADVVALILGFLALGVVALVVLTASAPETARGAAVGIFLAGAAWAGQTGNAVAHELIHRPPPLRWLGVAFYSTVFFGHHATAHPAVHHRHVATPADPNTARPGESFYRFARRAYAGSCRAAWAVERERLRRRGHPAFHVSNPFWIYVGAPVVLLAFFLQMGGITAVAAHLLFGATVTAQLLQTDYVQHYGLRRRVLADGRTEPVAARHSWNAPHWFSRLLTLSAPLHSDHHLHPGRPFPELGLPAGAPRLPHPLPVMAAIALWPRAWRRLMDPRVARVDRDAVTGDQNGEMPCTGS